MAEYNHERDEREVYVLSDLTTIKAPSPDLGAHEEPPWDARRPNSIVALQEDIPPNGGYGWVCTFCLFIINAHTWGVNAAWGVFLAHYVANSTFPEASLFEYALIGGLSISQALIISPIVTIATTRLGTRPALLLGTALIFTSLFTASYATKIWHLMLSQGIAFGWGMGFLYIPATAILPQWFSSKRSLAVGLATSGAGLGGLAYNLIAGKAVETVGLAWTYRILAFCCLGLNLIASLLLKDRNKAVKPQSTAFNYREFGHIEVVLVIIWGLMTELGYIVLLYSLPNYANHIGLSSSQGAVVGALLNLGLGIARPVVGYVSDSIGRINVAAVMTTFCGVLCLAMWIPANTYGLLLTFALLSGTACGTFWGTVSSVATEIVGLQRLPSVFGLICVSLVLPTTFAEPIGLQLVSAKGYLSSQIFAGCMFMGGATSVWLLRSWKISEMERKAFAERDDAVALTKHDFWLTPRKLFLKKRV